MFARLKAKLLALAGLILLVVGYAWKTFRDRARLKRLEGYRDTRKRMDEAEFGDDPAAAKRWLRERKHRRDL